MSRKNSRESSPDSVSASSKDGERLRSRKNSICDTDDEDDIEDPNGNILYSTESEKDPRLLRDVSPSAQSHHSSSGTGVALEWDPSADVGAQTQVPSNTPVHQALQQQSQNRSQLKARLHDIESGDLSALDQIVLALNYGYDLRPYVAESRSQRFDNVNDNISGGNSTGSGGTSRGQGHPLSPPVLTLSSSKGTSSEGSNNSNSSYKTATETDPDQYNNNLRDPTPNVSDMTNASWQTTGLTRSEIKYMKKKQESSSSQSQSSSSILWVEVNVEDDGDYKNDSNANISQVSRPQEQDTTTASEINGDTTSTPSFSKKSVGIQTKVKEDGGGGVLSTNQESQCQTENEPKPILNEQKSKMKSKRIQVSSENIKTGTTLVSQSQVYGNHRGRKNQDQNNDTDDFDPLSSGSGGSAVSAGAAVAVAAAAYFSSNGVRKYDDNMTEPEPGVQSQRHTVSVTGPGSGRSLKSHPSKSGMNVRRGNRINTGNSNSHGESSGQSSGSGISNLDSSDHLTPTCALLDKIITDGNATMRSYGYDVLEQHRNSLVYKMRKEFQHLERLNKILLEKRQGPNRSGAGSGSQRLTVETSVSTSDTSSGSRNHGGARQDQKIIAKSKLPQPRQVLVSSSQTPNTSSDSRGDNNIRIQIKQSRRPEIPLSKPIRGKEAEKKSRPKGEVYEFKKPLSYFLPFTSGPGFNSNRVIPSMEPRTSSSRKGSNSNGIPRNVGRRTLGVGPSADEDSNGEEKENDIPPPIRDPQEGEDQGQRGDNVDLYGGIAGGYVLFENELVQISLQQAFTQYCPTVMTSVQQREYLLAQLKQEREFKAQVKRNYFQERQNCLSPNDSLNKAFPAKETRLMSTKEMRHLTEKKLKKLPEVQERVIRRRKEEDKKTNRILSQVFSRKLRQHVLKGDMNIVHSKNLIRH